MGCSRPLPLLQLESQCRDLGLAVDGELEYSPELHAFSVSAVLEQLGQAVLSKEVDQEAYHAKLGWLERRLLSLVNELKAGLNQGKLALRQAQLDRRQRFQEFEQQAQSLLNGMLEHFLDCLDCMRELAETGQPDRLLDALAIVSAGMQLSQQYEDLCHQVEADLYPKSS